jgi:hypothetical protein
MSSQLGLISPKNTHSNVSNALYAKSVDGKLTYPTLVAPVSIQPADESTTANIYMRGASETVYRGAITLAPGANSSIPASQANGITIRTGAGPSTIVEVGNNAQGPNLLYIAGSSGVSEVYNEKYNPVIDTTAVASSTGSLPTPDGFGFTYTPTKTGAYMLQVNINVRNADTIPTLGFIEWVLSDGAEVQYASNTISSVSLIKVAGMNDINGVPGGIAEPTDFTSSNLCFLTAGVEVSFNITTARNSLGGGGQWAIQNYDARLIQMC